MFHIFCVSITDTAGVTYVQVFSPPAIMGSVYGLMNAVQNALGDIIGSSIGGAIYEFYGGNVLFLTAAIFAVFIVSILTLYVFLSPRLHKLKERNDMIEDLHDTKENIELTQTVKET